MGVSIFLLDRRTATLHVSGYRFSVGTLRRFFKVTELNDERTGVINEAAKIAPSPVAAMIMEATEMPLMNGISPIAKAHLVLGWDEGRSRVTDFYWDHLPQIGYAVRRSDGDGYTLYEERDGKLATMDADRARELRLLDASGSLVRHGQPRITACRAVRPYTNGYVEADCAFDDGSEDRLLVAVSPGPPPSGDWFVGKRPMDVERYPAT